MSLTREQILTAQDRKPEEVPVPEWGGTVLVRPLSGLEQTDFARKYLRKSEGEEFIPLTFRPALIALCVVDEHGGLVFTERDVQALGEKSGAAVRRVFDVASRLSGLADDSVEKEKKDSAATNSAA